MTPAHAHGARERTRRIVTEETTSLLALHGHRSRLASRSLVLAFVTGYLRAFTDQIDRDHPDPAEIAAVLNGVLDVVDPDTTRAVPTDASTRRTA